MAQTIIQALDDKKGMDIKLLKVRDLTVLTDYFVIASGSSNTHVRSLADEVQDGMTKAGIEPNRVEGNDGRSWILLDYGGVIVHVFYPEARAFYDLERLWADAEPVPFEV